MQAWDACLKLTNVNLEILKDPDMLLMVEKGIRGGVSMISTRYGKAKKPYMEKETAGKKKSVTKYVVHHLLNFMKSLD